ncbi:conserved hypothetical protein [Culex quinquefasciatus]|uniref:EF-hand domain-containing protein n=1 Tax=Culex quinquefasciatus TaxID=7176 RepID=B0WLJ4_CULQU|nr:conserved hypothetical protein [Culex quinquefasciatus]|eukprot:XP_001849578.1 conserved hypothetical protein [Culex quinquefasciatus]
MLCPNVVVAGDKILEQFMSARDDDMLLCVKDMGCLGSKDRLSKEDMDFLKSHTRYDESTIKEWYKGFKQDCPNGKLTPAKFVDMYKMFFPSGNAEEFCDHVFRTFDMDKNGYIDFKSTFFRVFHRLADFEIRPNSDSKSSFQESEPPIPNREDGERAESSIFSFD